MKNYKINIDKPKPTQEEILAGRDFDSVLKQYKAAPGKVIKKPFWKTSGFIGSVVAVAATVAVVLMVINGNNGQNPSDDQGNVLSNNDNVRQPDNDAVTQWTPTKRKIAPPLAGVNVPFTNYKVNAKRGGTLTHPSGTKIKFQAGSFLDANGNAVTGNVEVRYREMHDAVDIFLSGIPMQYDSAGQTWQLESAGMLDIAAFVDGKVVYLDKNKPMEVEFASAYEGTQYNLYEFDTVAGNWAYRGKDEVGVMPSVVDSVKGKAKPKMANVPPMNDIVIHEPVDGVKPMKADSKKNRFSVDFDKAEFPEMASFQNVIFEVDESNEKFDRANYAVTWESIALSRGDESSKYKLTLKKGLKQLKLDVYPVLDGKDYDKAFADYTATHNKYLQDSARYGAWVASVKNNQDIGVPNNVAQPQQVFNGGVQQLGNGDLGWVYTTGADKNGTNMAMDVMRSFTLSGFGTYNMDFAGMLPAGSILDLSVNGPDNKLFQDFTTVNHVDREKNTVMTYHNENPMNGFHVNTKSSNLIWAVKDGELYYAENESFSNLPLSGKVNVVLKKVAKKLNTADEMRAFFQIGPPSDVK